MWASTRRTEKGGNNAILPNLLTGHLWSNKLSLDLHGRNGCSINFCLKAEDKCSVRRERRHGRGLELYVRWERHRPEEAHGINAVIGAIERLLGPDVCDALSICEKASM